MNYGDAIHHKLVGLGSAFQFPVVHYVPAPVGAKRCTQPNCVKASAVVAFPEGTVFGDPVNNRRAPFRREVVGWTWRLLLQFNGAVSTEEFEESLIHSIPVIERNEADGRSLQVQLELEDAEYQNPVTQQPAQGTRVSYRFTARLTPT